MFLYLRLLLKKNFFLIWIGQIISQFGDKLTQIALVGLVSKISNTSSTLAFSIAVTIVPAILFSPFCGVYVDRWSKKKTMYISDFIRAFFIFLIAQFFIKLNFLPIIYLFIFLSFSVGKFFVPAKMAFIPQIVEKKDIFLANSLISITATVAAILGIGLGGIIVERFGEIVAFFIDALTFLFSAFAILSIRQKETNQFAPLDLISIGKEATKKIKSSFTKDLKEGLKYIISSKETTYAVYAVLFLFICIGGLFPVFTKFIQNSLGTITEDLGFVGVSIGVGIFLGSLIYARVANNFSVQMAINLSLLLGSIYLIIFCILLKNFASSKLAIFLSLFLGLLISPIFVGVNSLIHSKADNNFFGRVFSSLEFISHFSLLISMFIFASLADIFSPFTIIIIIGIIGILFATFLVFLTDKI
ncbi:MAG: MFS transporter [Candidatus Omnitrophica bacterium]|nr:MFS transporter [Candidatus Omnitrophota bacterium]